MDSRIHIFCGNYGSGKTEIAINMALNMQKQGKAVTLVDLDIVNPYFRSSEQRQLLESNGIKVLAPSFAGTAVDIPALPAEIQSVFADKSRTVIFDVGGDDTGATALGRYYPYLLKETVTMYMVINVNRPFSKGVNELLTMLRDIENKARQKVSYFINNSNLALQTTVADLIKGYEIIEELSTITGIPQRYVCGSVDILNELPAEIAVERYPITLYMRPDWLDEPDMPQN